MSTSGDTILGTITPTCKTKKNYCATWNVVSKDMTTGKKTTLAKTAADGQIWNWAFGAVSEDYGVVQCSDFPDDSSTHVHRAAVQPEAEADRQSELARDAVELRPSIVQLRVEDHQDPGDS